MIYIFFQHVAFDRKILSCIQLCNELVSVPCALVSVVLVLRIPIRTIIVIFIIGVPLVALWLYVDTRSEQQKKMISDTTAQPRTCLIRKHEEAKICFHGVCYLRILGDLGVK
jgi:uncharacterized membrane protein YfcA